MDTYESHRRRRNKARDRQAARYRRRAPMVARFEPDSPESPRSRAPMSNRIPFALPRFDTSWLQTVLKKVQIFAVDVWWYIRHNPIMVQSTAFIAVVVMALYFLSYLFSGRIMPNVEAAGIGMGSMSVDEAATRLQEAWTNEIRIKLMMNGDSLMEVQPEQMGIRLIAEETARAARGIGLRAIPFGAQVSPVTEVDFLTAQDFLLDLAEQIDTLPHNATYEWRNEQVAGIDGRDGHKLDVPLTLERLIENTERIIKERKLDLLMIRLEPDMPDPSPYADQVAALAANPPALKGYDPFTNQHYNLTVPPETFTSWLQADVESLAVREDTFSVFVDEVNRRILNSNGEDLRYLALDETMEMMEDAIANAEPEINLRVRYRAVQYEIQPGDWGYSISRKTGIPLYDIEQANSGINWNLLSVGSTITIPSRDLTMPNPPIPNKRIIVDLPTQTLVAYENGQEVFRWLISSGVKDAPTAPGIYQILNHDETAYGSSNTLCDSAGLVCGQWQMSWFMGIYSVVPGLVNGFHGAVLLPNGTWLPGGGGYPTTFGCIMSLDSNAKLLYDWAEVGTVVEILSPEFAPMSDLGRLALASIRG